MSKKAFARPHFSPKLAFEALTSSTRTDVQLSAKTIHNEDMTESFPELFGGPMDINDKCLDDLDEILDDMLHQMRRS